MNPTRQSTMRRTVLLVLPALLLMAGTACIRPTAPALSAVNRQPPTTALVSKLSKLSREALLLALVRGDTTIYVRIAAA
jgi:hypothetical protein